MRRHCESAPLSATPQRRPNVAYRILAKAACATLACLAIQAAPANASVAAHFAGVQTKVAACTSECFGVAVDSSGNVYIADTYNNRILEETPSATGYTQSVIATGLNKPYGVAVDLNGNVYVADTFNKQVVKETLSAGSYTPSVILSGLPSTPFNVAVDALGNVYLAGDSPGTPNSAYVYKLTPSGSSYSQSLVAGPSSGMQTPWEVAVDSSGDVFVSDSQGNAVYKETPSGATYTQSTVATGLDFPTGVAVDSQGNVYVSNAYTNQVLMESPAAGGGYTQSVYGTGTLQFPYELAVDAQGSLYIANPQLFNVLKETPRGGNFGSVNVGAQSQPLNMLFVFDSPGSIGKPSVVTQGTANLDFGDSGGGSCTTNGTSLTYSAGQTCILQAMFVPTHAGARYGAGMLTDNSSNVIATGYLEGTGVAPQVIFLPGAQTAIGTQTLVSPTGVAVDATGNLYVADFQHNRVVKETLSGGKYAESSVVSTAPNSPTKVAVDGSGAIYFATPAGVFKETPLGNSYLQATVKTSSTLSGLSVDGLGDVFLTDYAFNEILKETPTAAGYVESIVPSSGLTAPFGIAVDGSENVYVADPNNLRIVKETFAGGTYTQSTIHVTGLTDSAQNIAVDANNNLYISDFSLKEVIELSPTTGGYTQADIPFIGLANPAQAAIDGNGNVYVADFTNNEVAKLDRSDPPSLTFASTAYSSTSSDSPQSISLSNIGNADLTISIPGSGDNPTLSSGFTLDSSVPGACPQVNASSLSMGTVAAATTCEMSISFSPLSVGVIGGSLVLSDNNLNRTPLGAGTQTIELSGTAIQATPDITWATPAAITYGTALSSTQLNATSSVAGTFAYSPAAGAVLGGGSQKLSVSFTPTDTTHYTPVTDSVTLTVNRATPTISLASSVNPATQGQSVTFTATVISSAGTPSGSVTFWDGTTQLGSGALASGTATYSTTALAVGTHSITAVYSGDANFATVTSSAVAETVIQFSIGTPSGGSTTGSGVPGGFVTYQLSVTPPSTSAVTFTVSGLPTGFTATFNPTSVPAGAGPTNVTLTIKIPSQVSSAAQVPARPGTPDRAPLALGLLLPPLLGLGKQSRRLSRKLLLAGLAVVGLAATLGLSGCSHNFSSLNPGNGNPPSPGSYTLTVTAAAGAQTQSTTLTLNVQ